jgi:hypothetical protein
MAFWDWMTGATPAGIISEAGQKIVTGVFDGVAELIKTVHLPPEEEIQFKMGLAQLQLQTLQAQTQDVQSARAMQMQTRSVWPGTLTLVITVGFYVVLGIVIYHGLPKVGDTGSEAILLLIGSLTTGFSMVLTFWFGSTMGSQNKDQMLWKSTPLNGPPKPPS